LKIGISSDHGGFQLKEDLKKFLADKHQITDFGCDSLDSVDYPDYALYVCKALIEKRVDIGIVICSTGIGVSIMANKVKGVRCALVTTEFQAEMTRRHNDSNCLALGAKINTLEEAKKFTELFLSAKFEGGRHEMRVNKIKCYEEENL